MLELSAKGSSLSEYHLEAAIASIHATAPSTEETNWDEIVSLYDTLLKLRPSPVVELNRAIALGQRLGPERGLEALRAIADWERLGKYPFYQAAFGEFELLCGRLMAAREHFSIARSLSRNRMEREFFSGRVDACN